jgi:hypothetical protein
MDGVIWRPPAQSLLGRSTRSPFRTSIMTPSAMTDSYFTAWPPHPSLRSHPTCIPPTWSRSIRATTRSWPGFHNSGNRRSYSTARR